MRGKSFVKDSMGTIVDMAIGGATLGAIANTSLPAGTPNLSGFRTATEVSVGAALAGRTYGRMKKWHKL